MSTNLLSDLRNKTGMLRFCNILICAPFFRGSQWTGAYTMEFRDLMNMPSFGMEDGTDEPRYSLIQGGYVGEIDHEGELHEFCLLSQIASDNDLWLKIVGSC